MDILNTVSKKLKEDVYKEYFGGVLNNIKVLKFNFSPEVIEELSLYYRLLKYLIKNKIIVTYGTCKKYSMVRAK